MDKTNFFSSFRTKLALAFIISLTFAAALSNLLIYKFALDSQFNQLRDKLMAIAKTAAISIDTEELKNIPLNPQGIYSPAFNSICAGLLKIKQANPGIKYIYIMSKTETQGIWQFVADPDMLLKENRAKKVTSYPGDKYEVWKLTEMLKAFDQASADRKIETDEWGKVLSGYAPIRDKNGKAVAVLGIDISATDVYLTEKGLFNRGLLVLFIGIVFSLFLGIILSRGISLPIKKLSEGTKAIAAGNLKYKVNLKGNDELSRLAQSFNNMAGSLYESRQKLEDYFYRVVQSMVRSLEAKDPYTRGHSDRVSEYAREIAIAMGFAKEKVEILTKAAQLHDIGKLGIHEGILNKSSSLSKDEWELMQKHPVIGEEILKPVFLDQEMLSVIRSHHERYDGSGYPDALKGDETDIFAQITSIADAYDAMTSSRAYRVALDNEEAIKRLKKDSGKQFNPLITEVFVKILEKRKESKK